MEIRLPILWYQLSLMIFGTENIPFPSVQILCNGFVHYADCIGIGRGVPLESKALIEPLKRGIVSTETHKLDSTIKEIRSNIISLAGVAHQFQSTTQAPQTLTKFHAPNIFEPA